MNLLQVKEIAAKHNIEFTANIESEFVSVKIHW